MEKQGYIYILTNFKNSVFYTGVTSNLQKRIWEHKNNVVEGFTKKYQIHKLVYFEMGESIEFAIEREKYIKGKTRKFKKDLIEKNNPSYKDLYYEICE
jgi:putative endonuclease